MSRHPLLDPRVRAVGIPWYVRQDYPRILAIMTDSDVLPRNYDQWRKKADAVRRQIQGAGQTVVEVAIDPDAFPAWCEARGLDVDAKARSAFVNEQVYRQYGATH